jgi:UDP-N-acetylmuramoyl-L-alanyl-D-glutamate--2,6-diaminopimelate ligase
MESSRRVPLNALLERLPHETAGDAQRKVTAVVADSRQASDGALFVALPGEHTDGHRYVGDAIARGAGVIVIGEAQAIPPATVATVVRVRDTRAALSAIAAAFYGDPSASLDITGITGTNGKTTITYMVAAILNHAGRRCGVMGTVGAHYGGQTWQLHNTTPLPPELHHVLAEMQAAGAKAVAMEVSSHALALQRVDDVSFFAAALSNVTRDHLDFHLTPHAYRAAKRRLFEMSPRCVLNVDDDAGRQWAAELQAPGREIVTYALLHDAMLWPGNLAVSTNGARFVLDGQAFELHLPGRFNVANALAAVAVARMYGIADAESAAALVTLARVPGRMERIAGDGFEVIVDYAHTPDALENALQALRETAGARVAVVFGCGGDRDRGKRPEMGAIASRLADRIYLTNDNPRTEDPRAILDEIRAGICDRHDGVVEQLDRRKAIERAIADARHGDLVLVAGKGHENYQIVGDRVFPFDDAAVVRDVLARLPAR